MKKLAIFEEVVRIMQEDSATKKDKAGADPAEFRKRISEEMPDEEFLYVMKCYLASFGVMSHVGFFSKGATRAGFRLRFYDDALYVLQAEEETGLVKGDKIVTIDGRPISESYRLHREFFVSPTPERQYMNWAYLVQHAKSVGLIRDKERLSLTVGAVTGPSQDSAFASYFLNADTYYVKMENFSDEAAISQLYKEIFPVFARVKKVILDVRVNHGGSDSLYFPLLPYALSAGQTLKEIFGEEDTGMEILYTPTNVAHRTALFKKQLENPAISAETRQMIEAFTKELLTNQDKGFLIYEDDNDDFFQQFIGLEAAPERVIILTDVSCGSSGDNFVSVMKEMPKVTVVGRATMGILDYSNCCTVDFENYRLVYPTSRSLAIDAGRGMTDIGVLPHVEIPWTPEHLERDVDLAVAMELLGEKLDPAASGQDF